MTWLITSLHWYLPIFILGIVFFPLTAKIFKNFSFDLGYPFAKVLAILFVSYTAYVVGTIKILPFTRTNIILIVFGFILINIFFLLRKKKLPVNSYRLKVFVIIFEELLFLLSFLLWTYIRGQEPSIRSLEKFMDFGFINSIIRSRFFPPLDMWYAGNYPINYYYFGHLVGATLIKFTNIKPAIGYNLILSTIFALGITEVFSLVTNIIVIVNKKIALIKTLLYGLIGAFIVNLGGNLHTIYLFTTGYPNENPIPFWHILSLPHPEKYWYPNATRFIPFTIHEFPSYSYVVADLHGHVFDIPFVLLTLAILFIILVKKPVSTNFNQFPFGGLISTMLLGFLTAIHYMTNAFDGPIYALLTTIIFFLIFKLTGEFIFYFIFYILFFILFTLPFSFHFKPFVSGIGVNCGSEIFSYTGKIGPFLFEKGNCQISPFWMLLVLWGFFWLNFLIFIFLTRSKKLISNIEYQVSKFIFLLFSFGTFLVFIPEFFYLKDIYPAHFRANTMFKLGYQAFIMMGIASAYVFFIIKRYKKFLFFIFYFLFFILIFIYPFFSIPSYYGPLSKKVNLDGEQWLANDYPEDKEIIDYLNNNEKGQPVILEAQGDSYTDYERISAMTGLPTVAGWWVHEWLWRGSSDVVGKRIPEVQKIYEMNLAEESENYYVVQPNDYLIKIAEKLKFNDWKDLYELNKNQIKDPNLIHPQEKLIIFKEARINKNKLQELKELINKYRIKYIIVSRLERQKYPNLYEEKFLKIGKLLLKSNNGLGALYKVDY